MPNVGYAAIQIIPSVRGISDELRRQLVGPASDAADRAGQESGSAFGDKWKAGLAAAGAAAGAVLVAATVSAVEKERMADRLSAQLGLSGKGAKQAGKVAGDLYSKAVVDSFEDGAAAVRAVMGSGLIPEKATTKVIESITTKVADLANTFDQDLGGAANAATQLIRTGLAKDAPQALDLLTTGLQSSADKAGDFLDTINEYSTQFRKAGLDGSTAIGLLNQAIRAGARDSDMAADAIKEFSIRAVDGSDSSAAGFKALGLNAQDMGAKFAKGGSAANSVLDQTLDKLRSVKDPVQQSQIAVQLFGTQAEDLGKALFAMDPSKAADGLGKLDGAAKKVGDTIRGNTSTELKILQRQVMSVLGTVVTSVVLPALIGLIDAVRWAGEAVAAIGRWLAEWGVWLAPIAILIGGITLALNAQAIATGLVTLVFSAYRAAILVGTAVTHGFAAAQAVLNAVMALNPITLIVIALVALGAALVIAYQKSETFRNIVQGAWAGIQAAAMWAWNNVLKPAFDAFMVALRAIGTAALWLWNNAISPAFGFISTAARILATIITIVVGGPIYLMFKVIGAVVMWLWNNAIKPAFSGIGALASWLWANAIKPAFDAIKLRIQAIGIIAKWLWTNVISPVFGWIGDKAAWLWNQKIKPAWDLFKAALRILGDRIKNLWNTYVSPIFGWIGDKASWLWKNGIKPAFDAIKKAVGAVGDSFRKAKDFIGQQWSKLEGIAKKPIRFIINTIYNGGIVPVWNKVAKAFGAPQLQKMNIQGWATGGVLPGYTPGKDVHRFYSPTGGGLDLSGGEAIMRPEWTRAVGSGFVSTMNAAARHGGVRGVQRAMGVPGFADGGIFGWVKNTASKGVDLAKSGVSWLKDGMKASAMAGMNKIVKPLIDKISGSSSLYRDMVTGIPERMLKSLFSFSEKADKQFGAAGIGGKGHKAALAWARTQNGLPYQWGGNGNPSWDCSGFLSAIESVIRGQKPHRRWATGSFSGATAPPGWQLGAKSPFMIGITNAGVGHTAGTINGVNVESRGGDGVIVGSRARSYKSSLFTDVYGLKGYANGGSPRPGEIAWVGENGPELIRFSGGEVVYSNADSKRMAASLGGSLRGFAKGTTASRARKEVPGDLTAFTKSLKGSASAIAKAAKALADDLRKSGGAGKKLAAAALASSTQLQRLAKQRDSVDSRIAAGKAAAGEQKKTASDFLGLSHLGDSGSIGDLLSGMQARQATLKEFRAQISMASKKGVSQDLIAQLVAMGPESSLAGLVSGATAGQIKQLNAMAKNGAKLSTGYGNTMADAMFDAGKNAGRGFLTGLQSQEKELQAAMDRLGAGMVRSIKKQLKIKSPSRVTGEVGKQAGAGVVVGMDSTTHQVAAAAARMAQAAVPGIVPARASASSSAGGFVDGQKLKLVVRDREFDAYIESVSDGRVEAGLTQVRRAVEARR